MIRWAGAALACGMLLAAGAGLYAQDRFGRQRVQVQGNVEYDGRLAFVRVRYSDGASLGGFGGFGRGRGREPGWMHDYPTADLNLMQILKELTLTNARVDGSNIFALDDPELCKSPIAYMSEPGYWVPSDAEAQGLRQYLLKGGFIIFDDFRGGDWYNLEDQMRRVLPEHRFMQLDISNPIFHSFFDLKSLDILPSYGGVMPTYYGIFEDNDPRARLMAIANRDGDLGEYWEYSATGLFAVDLSNEAYKFGVNYMIYGLTR